MGLVADADGSIAQGYVVPRGAKASAKSGTSVQILPAPRRQRISYA